MARVSVQMVNQLPAALRRVEFVERKGIGHPDTMCDGIMEAASVALCQSYIDACGRVLHHNLDKSLLVAGQSTPRLGGGTVDVPIRLVFGDRATTSVNGRTLPIAEIIESAARDWLKTHLRFVDPAKHIQFQNEVRPGSPELVDIFARDDLSSNDTSAAVGYAPLTETETLVIEAEQYLNSPELKMVFPEAGEDVKVMGFREDRQLSLTVAAAFVDKFVSSPEQYFERKQAICDDLQRHLSGKLNDLDGIQVSLNTLDDPKRGLGGMYLTVLGTSAEGADGGEVGRGNRVNGVISLNRPMSLEAAAGKNPVSHVGKIYNLFSHEIARRIHAEVPGIAEVNVWMCSQIGRPLADPWSVSIELTPSADSGGDDLAAEVREVIERGLEAMPAFVQRLTRGELPVM